ncbi:MAG: serine/threonine protein kinase [Labilithrix sp.]|nr:serine/threonine protein kinase [Labilithrix sp.]
MRASLAGAPGGAFVSKGKRPLPPRYPTASSTGSPEDYAVTTPSPAPRRDRDSGTTKSARVVGDYTIGRLIARGGMSSIFEVGHAEAGGRLALKVMTDLRLADDRVFDEIHAHAATIAGLRSPHVVATYDAGRLDTGEPYVVMELLAGEDLATRLRTSGPLSIAEAVRYAKHACRGLAAAHAAGVVHQDLKPSNLVIVRDRRDVPYAKIIDFAPVLPHPADPDDWLFTGSPGYAAPEQLDPRSNIDARADVWAIGATLYELVTGRRAFSATTLADAAKSVREETPPPMTDGRGVVPVALEAIVRRCLAKDREQRYANIEEVGAALAAFEAELGKAIESGPSLTVTGTRRAPRLRTLALVALGPACGIVTMMLVRYADLGSLVSSVLDAR